MPLRGTAEKLRRVPFWVRKKEPKTHGCGRFRKPTTPIYFTREPAGCRHGKSAAREAPQGAFKVAPVFAGCPAPKTRREMRRRTHLGQTEFPFCQPGVFAQSIGVKTTSAGGIPKHL